MNRLSLHPLFSFSLALPLYYHVRRWGRFCFSFTVFVWSLGFIFSGVFHLFSHKTFWGEHFHGLTGVRFFSLLSFERNGELGFSRKFSGAKGGGFLYHFLFAIYSSTLERVRSPFLFYKCALPIWH